MFLSYFFFYSNFTCFKYVLTVSLFCQSVMNFLFFVYDNYVGFAEIYNAVSSLNIN